MKVIKIKNVIKNHLKLKILYFSFGPQEHKSYWLGLALTDFKTFAQKVAIRPGQKRKTIQYYVFNFN